MGRSINDRFFNKFKVECLNNLITISVLADIPRSFARIPTTWLSQLLTNVKVGQCL